MSGVVTVLPNALGNMVATQCIGKHDSYQMHYFIPKITQGLSPLMFPFLFPPPLLHCSSSSLSLSLSLMFSPLPFLVKSGIEQTKNWKTKIFKLMKHKILKSAKSSTQKKN
jgi:hypothetical protein